METLLSKAVELKLKYWLRSYSREQFKLQGRTIQLSKLDLQEDVLHAAIGLPKTLRVSSARVGILEIRLPSLSNVQTEPLVVTIDCLDMVLAETAPDDKLSSIQTAPAAKSTSYGLADKITDGMTVEVKAVNLMIETCGGSHVSGNDSAAWKPPLASVTIRGLRLFTTDENWQVVNLKEARQFGEKVKAIYVFKRLEWDTLSIDLLPHPDMFSDERLTRSLGESSASDGAKRLFFGGERFIDNITGSANITMHRTQSNNPLGLEVELRISEALCPALSEPGFRALLRFLTGLYVCINKDAKQEGEPVSTEVAGCSLITLIIDHVFMRIKETGFQLELLLQSLKLAMGSTSDGLRTRSLTQIDLGNMFLRDTHARPTCTLIQPSAGGAPPQPAEVPSFARVDCWPQIYPLHRTLRGAKEAPCMLSLYSTHVSPSPIPPRLAAELVVHCRPIKINLQEESCIRIASFLADGVIVEHGVVTPDSSLSASAIVLDELDLTVPMAPENPGEVLPEDAFTGARLHVEKFAITSSPFLKFWLLPIEKDAACYALWEGQPVNSSQSRIAVRAQHMSLALETGSCDDSNETSNWAEGLWRCIELHNPCFEVAMVTADGKPLVSIPPPKGVVRMGVACRHWVSNTSRLQLLFVLRIMVYMQRVSRALVRIGKGGQEVDATKGIKGVVRVDSQKDREGAVARLAALTPSDSAVLFRVDVLELKMLETVEGDVAKEGSPLMQVTGGGIRLHVQHRALDGAAAITSEARWQDIRVECVETTLADFNGSAAPWGGGAGGATSPPPRGEAHGAGTPKAADNMMDLLTGDLMSMDTGFEGLRASSENSAASNRMGGGGASGSERMGGPPQSPTSKQAKGGRQSARMRPVFWIGEEAASPDLASPTSAFRRLPFIHITATHIVPYSAKAGAHGLRVLARVAGVRLGGGMQYNEALLHRFDILGPDGGPGDSVRRVIRILKDKLLIDSKPARKTDPGKAPASSSPLFEEDPPPSEWELGIPEDLDVDLSLVDWILVLEGAEGISTTPRPSTGEGGGGVTSPRHERCWHSAFRKVQVVANSNRGGQPGVASGGVKGNVSLIDMEPTPAPGGLPIKDVTVRIEGLQAMKPHLKNPASIFEPAFTHSVSMPMNLPVSPRGTHSPTAHAARYRGAKSGLDLELCLMVPEDPTEMGAEWLLHSVKAAVREPMEVEATKEEIKHLITLCRAEAASGGRIAKGCLKLLQAVSPTPLVQTPRGSQRPTVERISNEGIMDSLIGIPNNDVRVDRVVSRIETGVKKSQALCNELRDGIRKGGDGKASMANAISELTAQLEGMQRTLEQLKGR